MHVSCRMLYGGGTQVVISFTPLIYSNIIKFLGRSRLYVYVYQIIGVLGISVSNLLLSIFQVISNIVATGRCIFIHSLYLLFMPGQHLSLSSFANSFVYWISTFFLYLPLTQLLELTSVFIKQSSAPGGIYFAWLFIAEYLCRAFDPNFMPMCIQSTLYHLQTCMHKSSNWNWNCCSNIHNSFRRSERWIVSQCDHIG